MVNCVVPCIPYFTQKVASSAQSSIPYGQALECAHRIAIVLEQCNVNNIVKMIIQLQGMGGRHTVVF